MKLPEENFYMYTQRYAIIQPVLPWSIVTKLTGLVLYSPSLGGPPVYQPDSSQVYSSPVHSPGAEVDATTTDPNSTTSSTDSAKSNDLLLPSGVNSGIHVYMWL